MSENNIKEIPYGVTDYLVTRLENQYYVDKTAWLKKPGEHQADQTGISLRRYGVGIPG